MTENDEIKYVVEFIGHDGKVRHTQGMSKMGAELALCLIPFESRVIPECESRRE